MTDRGPISFRGDSLEALRRFPEAARRRAGFQLGKVQEGREPDDWKPLNEVGAGVREIRIRDECGIFRVAYVTKIAEMVFVLHCFQKKTQKTNSGDLEIAMRRYKELEKEFKR